MNRDLTLFMGTFILTFGVVTGSFMAFTSATAQTANSVFIDDIVLSRCGEQFAYSTGTATYGPTASHLLVDVNGTQVFNFGKQTNWNTGLFNVGVGKHTVTARIHNTDGTYTDTTRTFEVLPCAQPSEPVDEPDCCPGPDPVIPEEKKVVKGVTIKAQEVQGNVLKPLNALFRSVFGRTPTFAEWKYWADRLLSDKPQYDALLGAMQWHQLHGRSIGD